MVIIMTTSTQTLDLSIFDLHLVQIPVIEDSVGLQIDLDKLQKNLEKAGIANSSGVYATTTTWTAGRNMPYDVGKTARQTFVKRFKNPDWLKKFRRVMKKAKDREQHQQKTRKFEMILITGDFTLNKVVDEYTDVENNLLQRMALYENPEHHAAGRNVHPQTTSTVDNPGWAIRGVQNLRGSRQHLKTTQRELADRFEKTFYSTEKRSR